MSSNNDYGADSIDCDRVFGQFAASGGFLDREGFAKLISDSFNCSDQRVVGSDLPSSDLNDLLIKVFDHFDLNHDQLIDRNEFNSMWSEWLSIALNPKSVLIVVDVQNDFISGSLSLENFPSGFNCSSIVTLINSLIEKYTFEMIVYTLDWHPKNHISFVENVNQRKVIRLNGNQVDHNQQEPLIVSPFDCLTFDINGIQREQTVYPAHCVQSTWGSQLHEDLKVVEGTIKIYKGTNPEVDSYSAFKDNESLSWTQLDDQLKAKRITDVYICGLAYDICVYHTVKDSISLKYQTILIEDCCKGTDYNQINSVRSQLIAKGCLIVQSDQVEKLISNKPWQLAYQKFLNLSKPTTN